MNAQLFKRANKSSTTKSEDPAIENSVNPLHYIERFLVKEPGKDQYQVKWKGYGNRLNNWYPLRALGDAQMLVDECEFRRTTRRQAAAKEDTNKKENARQKRKGRANKNVINSPQAHLNTLIRLITRPSAYYLLEA